MEVDFNSNNYELGHPHKMFRLPSPDRPVSLKSRKKKKIPESPVKKQVL